MFRKLLVYIFVFTSLQAQAASALACNMMNAVVTNDCCCGGMQMPAQPSEQSVSSSGACCTAIVVVCTGAGLSDSTRSAFKAPLSGHQPQPIVVPVATLTLLRPRYSSVLRDVSPGSISQLGTLTYLDTLRLRI